MNWLDSNFLRGATSQKALRWRGLLRTSCLSLLLLSSACVATSGALEKLSLGEAEMVDLTHPLSLQTPVVPESAPFKVVELLTLEKDGQRVDRFSLADNTGTHVEAPARLLSSQATVDKLPTRQFIGPGVVVDVTTAVTQEPGYKVSKNDILQWEGDNGPVPPDAIVLIRTGWSARYATPERYWNADAAGKPVFPGISEDAVDFLVRERRVQALGIDTASLYEGSGNSAGQRLFLTSGKFHINNLQGLDQVPAKGSTIVAVPLRIQGGPGAPARVLAIIPKAKSEIEPGKKKVEGGAEMGAEPGQGSGGMR